MKKFTLLIITAICAIAIASAASITSKNGKEEGRSLARIDATLKSYLGNPLTGLVYAASLAIGAISILSMYESPLSPLPVPSLPKPPVGRFPPENPIWPPVAKQPVKLTRHSSPYAASAVSPIYSLAPSKVSSQQEDNSWLEGQNLVQNYHNFLQSQGGQQILAAAAAAAGNANSGPSPSGSRRQDQLQAAHLQSYINQMSKVPSIRLKSNGQPADNSTPVSHSPAALPVKHSISSTVSEANSSLPSAPSSSPLSSSSSASASSSAASPSAASAAAAAPVDSLQDYSAAAAA